MGALLLAASQVQACTQEEAIEMMRALGQASTENLAGTPAQMQIAARMGPEVSSVGALLAESRFSDACARYVAVADKYRIDLDAYRAKLAPLQNDIPGECDVVEAGQRYNDAHRAFRESVDLSQYSTIEQHKRQRAFSDSLKKAVVYIQTEPQRACTMVDSTLKEFGAS